jgi:hypothetical protein
VQWEWNSALSVGVRKKLNSILISDKKAYGRVPTYNIQRFE